MNWPESIFGCVIAISVSVWLCSSADIFKVFIQNTKEEEIQDDTDRD